MHHFAQAKLEWDGTAAKDAAAKLAQGVDDPAEGERLAKIVATGAPYRKIMRLRAGYDASTGPSTPAAKTFFEADQEYEGHYWAETTDQYAAQCLAEEQANNGGAR